MFYWNPKPEIFVLPYLNFPILWYGALFALGFFVGFFLFLSILQKYLLNEPEYMESDILCPSKMSKWGKNRKAIAKSREGVDVSLKPRDVAARFWEDAGSADQANTL